MGRHRGRPTPACVEHLRGIASELQIAPVEDQVALTLLSDTRRGAVLQDAWPGISAVILPRGPEDRVALPEPTSPRQVES